MRTLEYIQRQTGGDPTYAVIWLHGLGADGHDFEPIVPELNLAAEPAVRFIFPHAPMRPVTINGGMVMRAWYDITGMEMIREEDAAGITSSARQVSALIEEQNQAGISTDHIVLAGFSQGGAIALHTGLRHPQPLSGIMALSTYVPLASKLASQAHQANRNTPIFMAHGIHDPVIPLALGENSRTQLEALGYPVEWHTYSMQHAVHPDEIRAIGNWLTIRISS